MSIYSETIRYRCDWRDENRAQCEYVERFAGGNHRDLARAAGWGAYGNIYTRRSSDDTYGRVWFCPTHAKVFGNNHGWGGLKDYEPPMLTMRELKALRKAEKRR